MQLSSWSIWTALLSSALCWCRVTDRKDVALYLGPSTSHSFCPLNTSLSDIPFDPSLPNVTYVHIGGTIAGEGPSPINNTGYVSGALDPLIVYSKGISALKGRANIHIIHFGNFDGKDLTSQHHLKINAIVNNEGKRNDRAGTCIGHGTDGPEVAYMLHRTTRYENPVASFGAGQPATSNGSEANRIFVSCIHLAISPDAKGREDMHISGDYILSAGQIIKSRPNMFNAFDTQGGAPLGYFDNLQPVFYSPPVQPDHVIFDTSQMKPEDSLPQVDIILGYPQFNLEMIKASIRSGVEGMVLGAYGEGHWPEPSASELKLLLANITTLIGSDQSGGNILQSNMGFGIPIGSMPLRSARITFQLALATAKQLGIRQEDIRDYVASVFRSKASR